MTKIPRGISNNNPGNIEYDGTKWQGLDDPPSDGRFCRFTSPEYGIRAIMRIVTTYYEKYGINTVRGIIERWAPPVENDTGSYAEHVASRLNVDPDTVIDPRTLSVAETLIAAIILHENGQQPYDVETIRSGILMA